MNILKDDKCIANYISKIEKYISFESKDDDLNKSVSELNKSCNYNYNSNNTGYNLNLKSSTSDFETYKATKALLDQERESYRKSIKEYDNEIFKLNLKCENFEKLNTDLEAKLKDTESELLLLKEKTKVSLKAQEESFNNSANNQELKNILKIKELEIEDIRRKNDLIIKKLKEENYKLQEKNENLEDKLLELNNLKEQNEKLFMKVKELNIYKDKKNEFENYINTIETKDKQIELLLKEKQNLGSQNDKLCDDLLKLKEKLSYCELEKNKLEYDLHDLKKENSRLENKQFHNIMNTSDVRKSIHINLNNNHNNNFNLLKDFNSTQYVNNNNNTNINNNMNNNHLIALHKNHNDNFIFNNSEIKDFNNKELNKENEEWDNFMGFNPVIGDLGNENRNLKIFEKEYQDLKIENDDLRKSLKQYTDINQNLILEKDKLNAEINHLKNHIEKLNIEKDKIFIEKGKLEVCLSKKEIEIKTNMISFEYKTKDMDENMRNINNKNELLKSDNLKYIEEIENLKIIISNINNNGNFSKSNSSKKLDEIYSYNNKKSMIASYNLNGESPANIAKENINKKMLKNSKDEINMNGKGILKVFY